MPIVPGYPMGSSAPQAPAVVLKKRSPVLVIVLVAVAALCLCGLVGGIVAVATSKPVSDVASNRSGPSAAVPGANPQQPAPAPTTTKAVAPYASVTYSGHGDKLVKLALDSDHVHVATISHSGRANFVITTLDASGGHIDLVVNEIGKYSGVRPLDFDDERPAAIEVQAMVDWTIVVADAATVPRLSNSTSGHGSAVLVVPRGLLSGL